MPRNVAATSSGRWYPSITVTTFMVITLRQAPLGTGILPERNGTSHRPYSEWIAMMCRWCWCASHPRSCAINRMWRPYAISVRRSTSSWWLLYLQHEYAKDRNVDHMSGFEFAIDWKFVLCLDTKLCDKYATHKRPKTRTLGSSAEIWLQTDAHEPQGAQSSACQHMVHPIYKIRTTAAAALMNTSTQHASVGVCRVSGIWPAIRSSITLNPAPLSPHPRAQPTRLTRKTPSIPQS